MTLTAHAARPRVLGEDSADVERAERRAEAGRGEARDGATKVLKNPRGEPLYLGDMALDPLLEARALVDAGDTLAVVDLKEPS